MLVINFLKLAFFRITAALLAFAQLCTPSLKKFEPLDPSVGKSYIIEEHGWSSRVLPMSNGELLAAYETADSISTALSTDNGATWHGKTVAATGNDYSYANVNIYEKDKIIYLAYRATKYNENKTFYSSLHMCTSADFGKTWKYNSLIVDSTEKTGQFRGVWEPYLGEINGKLTCMYANDNTSDTLFQFIEAREFDGKNWSDRKIICNGTKHASRDGMPVFTHLSTGEYVLVIESTQYAAQTHPFMIKMLYSLDGINWSEPRDVYIPKGIVSKASAPGIIATDDGRIGITFQTDEDKVKKGDKTSVAKIITTNERNLSKISPLSFSEPKKLFPSEFDEFSTWGGVSTANGFVYYSAGTYRGATVSVFSYH